MTLIATLMLKPSASTLPSARAWFERMAREQRWLPHTAFAMLLSMDEALTNILIHGYAQGIDTNSMIELSIHMDHPLITLEIIDNGTPFDPTSSTPADLADKLENTVLGGHGIRLMRHYLDEIVYTFADGRNHLRLTARQTGI